jgi:hypothetical protein
VKCDSLHEQRNTTIRLYRNLPELFSEVLGLNWAAKRNSACSFCDATSPHLCDARKRLAKKAVSSDCTANALQPSGRSYALPENSEHFCFERT